MTLSEQVARNRRIARELHDATANNYPGAFELLARTNPDGLAGRLTRTLTRASRATAEAEGRRWLRAVHVGDSR